MNVMPAAFALVVAWCALPIPAAGQDRPAEPRRGDGRLDASFAKVLFQEAQAEASVNKVDPKAKPKHFLDWTPGPMQADVTLEQLEKLILNSPYADARLDAVSLYAGGCRNDASGGTSPCVTGDSALAGAMSDELYRSVFQKQLVASLQRLGEKTSDAAVRGVVVDLLIGTMTLVRTKALGFNYTSCYFTAEKAVDALAAIHRRIGAWLVIDAPARDMMDRIVQALRGSAAAETVPELKAKMQKAFDSVGARR